VALVPLRAGVARMPAFGPAGAAAATLAWRTDANGSGPVLLDAAIDLPALPPTYCAAPWDWQRIRPEYRAMVALAEARA
jgi:hypothetical protein